MQQEENLNEKADNLRGQSAGAPEDTEAKETAAAAHFAAEHDIDEDPDLATTEDPAADLDEGELARLDNSNDGGGEDQK